MFFTREFPRREWRPTPVERHIPPMARAKKTAEPAATFLDAVIREAGFEDYAEVGRQAVPPATNKDVWRLAKGDEGRQVNIEWARRLSPAINIAPLDLIEQQRRRVPLEWRVASQFAEREHHDFQICGAAREWYESRQPRLTECFAAVIEDDSADRFGWPPGTMLFLRRVRHAALQVGDIVLVRALTPAGGTAEVFIGRLGYSIQGDLTIATNSTSAAVPSVVVIRYAPRRPGLADAAARYRPATDRLEYLAAAGDLAEILGVLEFPAPRA